MIYHIWGEHGNHYATDAVHNVKIVSIYMVESNTKEYQSKYIYLSQSWHYIKSVHLST